MKKHFMGNFVVQKQQLYFMEEIKMQQLKSHIYDTTTLEESHGLRPVTEADAETIDNLADQEIEISIDSTGRVWQENGIYVANVETV